MKFPETKLSQYQNFYCAAFKEKLYNGDVFHAIYWDLKNGFFFWPNRKELHKETKQFVFYSVKNHLGQIIPVLIKNTLQFLFIPGYIKGMDKNSKPIDAYITEIFPQDFQAKNSLQYKGKIFVKKFKLLYVFCFYLSLISFLGYFFLRMKKQIFTNELLHSFIIFTTIILIINACAMSNFVGIYLRFQLRIMLLPILAAFLIIKNLKIFTKTH